MMFEQADYNRTLIALDMLVTNSLRAQEVMWGDPSLAYMAYRAEDYKIVRMMAPRGMGTTSAIKAVSHKFSNPMFGGPTMVFTETCYGEISNNKLFSAQTINTRLRGRTADAVFYDGASIMSSSQEEALIEVAMAVISNNDWSCLVLVG